MQKRPLTNYAFLDHQNIHLGIRGLGWRLHWARFRIYLQEKYAVRTAYQFIGYLPENQNLYRSLQEAGYVLVFKPVLVPPGGRPKGNVDADLVLQAMIDYRSYEKAVIVTSDGDFWSLVNYLYEQQKLKAVLSPNARVCSALLKKAAREKLQFLEPLRHRLEYSKE
jgi:uncharacterized LabA/DUF88 family protein